MEHTEINFMRLVTRLKGCCQASESEIRETEQLTDAEYRCLSEVDAEEPLTSGELSKRIGVSPSRGSRIIEAMVQSNLLVREQTGEDRRVSSLSLSTKGKTIKKRITAALVKCERKVTAKLSRHELKSAVEGLSIAIRALEEGSDTNDNYNH